MGRGYYIIVGHSYGSGLNLNDGRLYYEGDHNWWPWHDDLGPSTDDLLKIHPDLSRYGIFKVLF